MFKNKKKGRLSNEKDEKMSKFDIVTSNKFRKDLKYDNIIYILSVRENEERSFKLSPKKTKDFILTTKTFDMKEAEHKKPKDVER